MISVAEEIATIKAEDVDKAFAEMLSGRRPKLSRLKELKKLNKKLRNSVRILEKGTFSLE